MNKLPFSNFLLVLLVAGLGLGAESAAARQWDESASRIGLTRIDAAPRGNHTCFVRGDGNVLCWGSNDSGQLGNGTIGGSSSTPALVPGITTAIAVAVSTRHSCVLLVTATVQCWGANDVGQLGVGTGITSSAMPVTVSGITNAVSIAAGGPGHTCARLADGSARCWGRNSTGQLGNGTSTDAFTPVVVSGLTDAVAIAVGQSHTCALRANGTLSCWGANADGQLGTGNTNSRRAPTAVPGLSNVTTVTAGDDFTCARVANGTFFCWGDNLDGQLSLGTAGADVLSPAQVQLPDTLQKVTRVTAGDGHACAVAGKANSSIGAIDAVLLCWGRNLDGQLGIGTVGATGFGSRTGRVLEVATGSAHTCVLQPNDTVQCTGANVLGQLGSGNASASASFVNAFGVAGSIAGRSVAAGGDHSCASRANGVVSCWGKNDQGQLGDDTFLSKRLPVNVKTTEAAVSVVAGDRHTCMMSGGIFRAGQLCWGDNLSYQIANDSGAGAALRLFPTPFGFFTFSGQMLAAGNRHTCYLPFDGQPRCLGRNNEGAAGPDPRGGGSAGGANVVSIAAGATHSCALRADGTVWCWGRNVEGQLGNDSLVVSSTEPVQAAGLTSVVSIAAGGAHTCALRVDGTVACWGSNLSGQIDGSVVPVFRIPTPTSGIAVGGAVGIASGDQYSCIVTATGGVRCWGSNVDGQLGNSSTANSSVPVFVRRATVFLNGAPAQTEVLNQVVAVAAGTSHACALRVTGQPVCWGDNDFGQIGDNSLTDRRVGVGVNSFTANIAPSALLAASSRTAKITLLLNCATDARFFVDLSVEQGSSAGSVRRSDACTGGMNTYEVQLPAQGSAAFTSGPARATAKVLVKDEGVVIDEQTWSRDIVFDWGT